MSSHLHEISGARSARVTEEMLAVAEHEDILRQSLSVHSIISTPSGSTEHMDPAKFTHGAALVVIGRGTCGTIFGSPGMKYAYKKGSDKDALWNDANLTNIACRAVMETKTCLQEIFPKVEIPRVPLVTGWINGNNSEKWWRQNLSRFPMDTQIGYLFQVQRILSLPRPSRAALIRLYFPKEMRPFAYEDRDNKVCLVRPYLGHRRTERELSHPAPNLWNFPLYLDQIEELELEAIQFSEEMAIGLAIIHWKACLDGMDMEFVLGSATTSGEGELPTVVENFKKVEPFDIPAGDLETRQVHLWMLDFDKADQLNLKESWKSCCDRMVAAVTANDPYFPNPAATGTLEQNLWETFERAYLLAASYLLLTQIGLSEKANEYPALFLKAWKKRATELAKDTQAYFVRILMEASSAPCFEDVASSVKFLYS